MGIIMKTYNVLLIIQGRSLLLKLVKKICLLTMYLGMVLLSMQIIMVINYQHPQNGSLQHKEVMNIHMVQMMDL